MQVLIEMLLHNTCIFPEWNYSALHYKYLYKLTTDKIVQGKLCQSFVLIYLEIFTLYPVMLYRGLLSVLSDTLTIRLTANEI